MGPDLTIIGRLNLNMTLKIEFEEIKVVYGLVKDIKGYHIQFWLSSTSSYIEKSYGGYRKYWNLVLYQAGGGHTGGRQLVRHLASRSKLDCGKFGLI
jgi:hypothetical protein